jgi:hypothetical protein
MPRYLRYVRIGWTVLCGIACVLLVVLWIRSDWSPCCIYRINSSVRTRIAIAHGEVVYTRTDFSSDLGASMNRPWTRTSSYPESDFQGFDYNRRGIELLIQTPIWFPLLLMGSFSIAPWIIVPLIRRLSWRFSLRTLLLALTVAAVVLGLIVYAVR